MRIRARVDPVLDRQLRRYFQTRRDGRPKDHIYERRRFARIEATIRDEIATVDFIAEFEVHPFKNEFDIHKLY